MKSWLTNYYKDPNEDSKSEYDARGQNDEDATWADINWNQVPRIR